MRTILFVCTGNTCRSPMAAAIFNKMAKDMGIDDVRAESAGLAVMPGEPASKNAITAAGEVGADLSEHSARQVTREIIDGCEAVYAMSQAHANMLKESYPDSADKISVLAEGIPDPFGGDLETYRYCRDTILKAVKNIIEQVK